MLINSKMWWPHQSSPSNPIRLLLANIHKLWKSATQKSFLLTNLTLSQINMKCVKLKWVQSKSNHANDLTKITTGEDFRMFLEVLNIVDIE